jgi:cytochrome oxidase assembly protein ShyY1
MSNLIKEPFSRLSIIKNIEETIGGAANVKDYGVHWYSLLIVLIWIVIFVLMSYKILKKRDL